MSSRISRSSLSCLLLLSAIAGCGGPSVPSASKVQAPSTAINVAMAVEGSTPTGDDAIVVFPQRDFVVIEAFTPDTKVHLGVFRQDTTAAWRQIGFAEGTTDGTGFVEVNHAGAECWLDPLGTPDILPGDAVVVEEVDADGNVLSHSETIARDVTCDVPRAVFNADGTATVTITGTLPPTPPAGVSEADYLEQFEERLINPDLPDRRDRRAAFAAPDGNIGGQMTFTDRARGEWVATYLNVPAAEVPLYLAAESRILWRSAPLAPNPDPNEEPANNEITIYENPGSAGPAEFRCGAYALNAFDESPKFVNATSATAVVNMKGKAQGNAQSVQILVDGAAHGTLPIFDPLCVLPKAWTWAPGTTRYSDLLGANTSVTLTPLVTLDGFQLPGAPSKIILDQTAPVVSAIVMGNGRFAVNANEPLAEARFVFNGTATETSTLYTGPVTIPAGATVSVWAKDRAGNVATAGGQAPTGDVVAPNLTVSNSAPQGQVARFRNPGIVTVVSDDAAATVTIDAFRNAETTAFQTVTSTGSATITIQRPNGGRSPVYTLRWKATDAAGNTATGSSQYRF